MSSNNLNALNHLLKATSKVAVEKCLIVVNSTKYDLTPVVLELLQLLFISPNIAEIGM